MILNVLLLQEAGSVLLLLVQLFFSSIVDRYVFITILFFFFHSSSWRRPFNISYNTGLVMMNPIRFFLSGKLFICPLILNDSFVGQSNPYFSRL